MTDYARRKGGDDFLESTDQDGTAGGHFYFRQGIPVVDIKQASGLLEAAMDGVRQAESRGGFVPRRGSPGKLRGARGHGWKLRLGNCRNLGSYGSDTVQPASRPIHRDHPRQARPFRLRSRPALGVARPLDTLHSTLPDLIGAGSSLLASSELPDTADTCWQRRLNEASAELFLAGRMIDPPGSGGEACPSSGRNPW
jgi:hypothetical protein